MSKPFRMGAPHAISIFVGAFALIIAVNVVFVTLALRSFPGEDEPKSYVQGVRYNETLHERALQKQRGWRATAELVGDQQAALVQVQILDAQGMPVEGLALTGTLRRPASAKLDQALAFKPIGQGRYAAHVSALAAGQWALTARAVRDDTRFDIQKHMMWGVS